MLVFTFKQLTPVRTDHGFISHEYASWIFQKVTCCWVGTWIKLFYLVLCESVPTTDLVPGYKSWPDRQPWSHSHRNFGMASEEPIKPCLLWSYKEGKTTFHSYWRNLINSDWWLDFERNMQICARNIVTLPTVFRRSLTLNFNLLTMFSFQLYLGIFFLSNSKNFLLVFFSCQTETFSSSPANQKTPSWPTWIEESQAAPGKSQQPGERSRKTQASQHWWGDPEEGGSPQGQTEGEGDEGVWLQRQCRRLHGTDTKQRLLQLWWGVEGFCGSCVEVPWGCLPSQLPLAMSRWRSPSTHRSRWRLQLWWV